MLPLEEHVRAPLEVPVAHSSGMSYSGAKLLHQAVQVSSPRQNMCTPVTFCRRDSSATSV